MNVRKPHTPPDAIPNITHREREREDVLGVGWSKKEEEM